MSDLYAVTAWERHIGHCRHCEGGCLAIYLVRFFDDREAADYGFCCLSRLPGVVICELLELQDGNKWRSAKVSTKRIPGVDAKPLPCVPTVGQQQALLVQEYDAAAMANPLLQPVGLAAPAGDS